MNRANSFLTVAILGICAGWAQAQTPAFQPSSAPFITGGSAVNLGMVFTPNMNISVDELGFYNVNFFNSPEIVGIYNSIGTLLTSATVTSADPLVDGYFWANIPTITLSAGQQYTVDTFDPSGVWAYGVPPVVNSDITYDGQTYDYTSVPAFPTFTAGHAPDAYYGPDFSIGTNGVSGAAPDGGLTALLLGASFTGMGWLRRKF
jgi:hypothetical protein